MTDDRRPDNNIRREKAPLPAGKIICAMCGEVTWKNTLHRRHAGYLCDICWQEFLDKFDERGY